MLARASRIALPGDHPVRRMLSIFTFGAIFVNLQAQFMLTGRNMLLHRATPFVDFEALSEAVPEMLPDVALQNGIYELLNEEAYEKLPAAKKETPFFSDGKLIMDALLKLSTGMLELNLCDAEGNAKDEGIKKFYVTMQKQYKTAKYQFDERLKDFLGDSPKFLCHDLSRRMAAYMFGVTAWHSHVGFVGDYYIDPTLAGMSWAEGESRARPRQSVAMSVINVFTSTKQPALMDDYSHLFKGIAGGPLLEELWAKFLGDLKHAKRVIDARNEKRTIRNIQFDPAILESSVSK